MLEKRRKQLFPLDKKSVLIPPQRNNRRALEELPLTDYLTEQEQIELLKNWIKQYGPPILLGIVVVLIAVAGWRYWQAYNDRTLTHASGVYDEMLTVRAQNNTESTLVQADKLLNHYPNTPYGQIAALMLARNAVINKNYPEAEKQLKWVIKHSNIASMRQIARLRLARLYVAQTNPEAALKILHKTDESSFLGLIDEVRGDAYLVMKNTDAAQQAYRQALQELPNAEIVRPLLQMKYDNLSSV